MSDREEAFQRWYMLQSKMPYRTPEEIARMAYEAGREQAQREPWQPIETALKDGTEILLGYANHANHHGLVFSGFWDGDWWDSAGEEKLPRNPTHWMPMPPPPQFDKE